ncbi:YbaY family lipoprotein [Pseudomonas aeruginosa]|uniref:YbaY family lipoprotein n=1 Tax=Pseudomonas aeruginosa TaxID=287 RepID=UPI001D0A78D1|nr:YbaY family lipoprotein [Pseudomonas aeruginosa]MCC0415375.1 YbaY family lipoprotein [Pseudomonas aeruginosa]
MEQPMTLCPIALLAVLLLAACSSDKPKPAPTPQASRSVTMVEPVLPAHLRELSGTLSSIQGSLPRGSEVQMALLVIDERDRPQRLLASETVLATGELMPFRLPFNPESFPPAGGALRVELHARVIQSGQLAWRLHPLRIAQPTTQSLGELRLVRAP